MFVTGELSIGYNFKTKKAAPIPATDKFKITLYGRYQDDTVVYDNVIEAGNKVIASIGKVQLHGTGPKVQQCRLLASVDKGDTEIMVDKLMDDWKVGERIFIATSGHWAYNSDYATIKAYDSATGKLTLTAPLKFYHFGDAASTESKYKYAKTLDLRSEVVYFGRSVLIEGDSKETDADWGG